MKDHLYAASFAGLLVWGIVGFTNSMMTTKQEQSYYPIAIPETVTAVETIEQVEIDVDEMHCLAKNIYFEARGESTKGKIAVANVTMNRVDSPKYPNTICNVVYQAKHSKWWLEHHNRLVPIRNQCQFSWYCDGKSDTLYLTDNNGRVIKRNMESWLESIKIAEDAIRGNLNTVIPANALWYHADFVQPYWSTHYKKVDKVGAHIFYTST